MLQFKVGGMTCGHCVRAVTEAVQGVDPAARVDINLETGDVRVESQASAERIGDAIIHAGYDATLAGAAA